VIAIVAMKIIAVVGWRIVKAGIERRITAIRFVWIPGMRPVIVPRINPKNIARNRLSILFYLQ